MQEDYRKITVERKGEQNFFTSQMIKNCMKKVVTVNLHQTVKVGVCLHTQGLGVDGAVCVGRRRPGD